MESWYTPSMVTDLPCVDRILVLAPHPDDEIFGPGGTIIRFHDMGIQVLVCVLTDGAGYMGQQERAEIFEKRQSESLAALQLLGLPAPVFFGFRDRSLAGNCYLVKKIKKQIDQYKPNIVFVPSLWEVHPDHLATARATMTVLQTQKNHKQSCEIWFYEVGSPLRANCLIDITDVWYRKQRAMDCFASQLIQQNYSKHIEAINIYRTYSLPSKISHAEAFFRVTAENLFKYIHSDGEFPGPFSGLDLQVQSILATADAEVERLQNHLVSIQRIKKNEHQLYEKIQVLERNVASVECERDALLASFSWKITAPLRWISRHLNRWV